MKLSTFGFNDKPLAAFTDSSGLQWFRASEVCDILRFKNAFQSVKIHADGCCKEFQLGKGRPAVYLTEAGLYRMIFASKAPDAKAFQDWIFDEVLPSIRKQGSYIAPTATIEQLALATERIHELEAELEGKISEATENRIVEKTMDFLCETDDQNGDPLLFQTYLKNENKRYKEFVQAIGVEIARISSTPLKGRIQKQLASMD